MRLKNDTNNYAASFNITPPYQMLVLHSKVLIYPAKSISGVWSVSVWK